ncbi:MAG TPA: glycosyltransferase family 2 protein [Terriglobales bacterium]|nr:glycosyltransferase family 2 protein [Terriglobales bacterium]
MVSIVIPAMNERITIRDFVRWCKEGLLDAAVEGEILIVDSSSDDTAEIALEEGARVLKVPKRGLGRAYIDAIPHIRGKWVLMGDADCTYDFRKLAPFIEKFKQGYEYVMGSRFHGSIEAQAMPALHQYFGTPLTTGILNLLYATHFSDIHCGMRGITREALEKIELESEGWEYASEMVLKAVCLKLKTAEVPVTFLKDREGRLSHLKRNGWLEPWRSGWRNLETMFLHGADFFLLKPGLIAASIGWLVSLALSRGPVRLGSVTLSLFSMMLSVTLALVGLECFCLGCITQVLYGYSRKTQRGWLRIFDYDRTTLLSGLFTLLGVLAGLPLVRRYIRDGYVLSGPLEPEGHMAVLAILLTVSGFLLFGNTLVLHAVARRVRPRRYQAK